MRTIAITNIVQVYELVWIYRVNRSRHYFAMFSALWCLEWRIISASLGEFGVVVIGFGINLCVFQWIHRSCLFNVFGLDKISLSTTVSLATWCISILLPFCHILNFHPLKLNIIGWWHLFRYLCLILRLSSDESLEWLVFSLTNVSPSHLLSALYRFSSCRVFADLFCSTVFSHLSVSVCLFSMTGSSWLNTDSLNSLLAGTHTHWGSQHVTLWACMSASFSVPKMLVHYICHFNLALKQATSPSHPIVNAHIL